MLGLYLQYRSMQWYMFVKLAAIFVQWCMVNVCTVLLIMLLIAETSHMAPVLVYIFHTSPSDISICAQFGGHVCF